MSITKEHYIDRFDLLALPDIEAMEVAGMFVTLSNGESEVTKGSIRMSVNDVLALKSEYDLLCSKIRPARGA